MIRTRFLALATAAGVLLSAASWAQQAVTTGTTNVRAGPDVDFPVVARLAPGTPVHVDGCLPDYRWCDVDFGPGRGWVHTSRLQSHYGTRVVPVYSYGATIGLPVVTFSLFNYWDRHYRDRPWYRDRSRWEPRWGGHDRGGHDRRWDHSSRWDNNPRWDNNRRWDNNDRWRDNDQRWQGRRDNDRRWEGRREEDRQRAEIRAREQQLQQQRQHIQQQREQQIRQERAAQPRQPGQSRVSGDDRDWTRERQGQ